MHQFKNLSLDQPSTPLRGLPSAASAETNYCQQLTLTNASTVATNESGVIASMVKKKMEDRLGSISNTAPRLESTPNSVSYSPYSAVTKVSPSFLFSTNQKLSLVIPPNEQKVISTPPRTSQPPNTPTTPNASHLQHHHPPSQPLSLIQFQSSPNNSLASQNSPRQKQSPPALKPASGNTPQTPVDGSNTVKYPTTTSISHNSFVLPPSLGYQQPSSSTSPFILSQYSSIASPSKGSSSNHQVHSPSLVYGNSTIFQSQFTYNYIQQNGNTSPAKSQREKLNTFTQGGDTDDIARLELFYKKKRELLASQLISKLDVYCRSIVAILQDILLRLLETTDDSKLAFIQHFVNLKKHRVACVKEVEEYSGLLQSCTVVVSKQDMYYLEEIERTLNCFKQMNTSRDEIFKNMKQHKIKIPDEQYLQYVTQLSIMYCVKQKKSIPDYLTKALNYFSTPQFNSSELIQNAKGNDNAWAKLFCANSNTKEDYMDELDDTDDDVWILN